MFAAMKTAILALAVQQAVAQPPPPPLGGGGSCADALPFCPNLPAGACSGPGEVFSVSAGFSAISISLGSIGTEVWYKLTVDTTCTVDIAFDTCSSAPGFDADLEVFTACGGTAFASDDDTCTTTDDALLEFAANPSGTTTYYIRLSAQDAGSLTGPENFSIQGSVTAGICGGDPHFYRWGHEKRDSFHGECDLVLMHKEDVIEGDDLDVHVRTTIRDSYSYIEAAAMKLGEHAVEFQKKGIFVDGEKIDDSDLPFKVGSSEIVKDLFSKKPKYSVVNGSKLAVEVTYTKQFMTVKVAGANLDGSTGMLGDRKTGDMIARDGRILEDFENFSFEWQVSPEDPQIFMHAREPQLPYERCRMPSVSAEARRRKLRGQDRKLYDEAVAACTENHIPANVQSCVDDVMFTGEIELAEAF